MASKRPTTRTAVDIYTSTRDLLKRIKAMPGNGRSCPVIMDILVRDEAVRLGLIEAPASIIISGPAPEPGTIGRGRGRQVVFDGDGNILEGPMHEGTCLKCGQDVLLDPAGELGTGMKWRCVDLACTYRC